MSGKNPLGNGREPQSYEGLNVIVPVTGWQLIKSTRNPTSSDKKYPVGAIWINTSNNTAWLLTSAPGNWSEFAASVAGAVTSLTGDSGGAIQPAAGNITLAGTSNQIATSGAGSTITFSLVGPYTPSTYTAHGVLVGEGTSSIAALAAGTNGQVLLGSTGADPVFGTLTTTTGVAFTTGAGSLAINVKTGGYAVVDQTSSSVNLAVQTLYVTDNGSTQVVYTLPATAPQGSVIEVVGSSAGGWKIAQNASQQILLQNQSTTAGTSGSLSSTNKNDSVKLVASVGGASTIWTVVSYSGTFTFV